MDEGRFCVIFVLLKAGVERNEHIMAVGFFLLLTKEKNHP
jgi:hypothetical protein